MLNFDSLPKDRPAGAGFPLLPNGYSTFKIISAEVKKSTGEKTAGKDYLELVLQCTDIKTGISGRIWDTFYDSDKSLTKYKLRQLLIAVNCILKGDFTFKDLTKILINKEGIAAVKINENPGYKPKNEINVFDDEIYYPMSDLGKFKDIPTDDPPFEFTASDGMDPTIPLTPEEEGEY
jgi:hypothetical protein